VNPRNIYGMLLCSKEKPVVLKRNGSLVCGFEVSSRVLDFIVIGQCTIDPSRVPTSNDAESRSGWTKIQQMHENVHPNLAQVLLFVRTEVECGKSLLTCQNLIKEFTVLFTHKAGK